MEDKDQNKIAEEQKENLQETANEETSTDLKPQETVAETTAEKETAETATEEATTVQTEETTPEEKPEVEEDVTIEAVQEDTATSVDDVESAIKQKQNEEHEELERQQEDLDKKAEDVNSDEDSDDDHEEEPEEDTTVYESLSLEELVSLMEDLVKIENIVSIKNKVLKTNIAFQEKFKEFKKEHKENYLKEGGNPEEYKFDDGGLLNRYNHSFKIYKQKRKEYLEAQEILKQGNLKRKNEVLDELRKLIESEESLKKIYDEFKLLQEKWRQIGMVPKNDAKNLWMNYNFLVDKFFEKVQIDRDLRDIGYKKNLEAKIELTEKTEELLLEKSITKSFKLLQEYHRRWREIGPVPHDKSDEIWERFKAATEKVNQRRREYYEKLEEEQKNNLVLKTELCEKAEIISEGDYSSSREWNEKTREFDELFEQWRKIGPAPKKDNDAIWNRFKSSMNAFYKNKKAYFSALREEQMNNYHAKLDICKTAEAMQDSSDWKTTTRDLINLQKEWKKIGPVPHKYSDKIWKRFRAACDHFFNRKEEYFKNLKDSEKENLEKKKALIETIKNTTFDEDKEAALNQMKELQKQWFDIGQVPFKEKDKINKEFRAAVDEKLSEIGLSSVDIELIRIREKVGNDERGNKEAKYIITKEMNSLKAKIDKMMSEITTWENNIGLFANSKNADVIKKEIQAKIDSAHDRINKMKARMRQLDKTLRAISDK